MKKNMDIRLFVRLSTQMWGDKNGLYQKTVIKFLKRRSVGFNFLEEDCAMMGADEVLPRIINLNSCEDGIYQVVICNEHKDWETGRVEDWDYELVKVEEQKHLTACQA